ncbi:hypothetical protein GCM10009087_37870 [Sphingomonas oligophenolica]|uniref:DUF4136 domain-containing protein n=1 Tax=Sphingomonas oligophenolica TaxID=301154 RepID=A0ABU9Y505_9SPHN
MSTARILLVALAATGLAGCTTTESGPVHVTRYHLGAPLERGTVAVEPAVRGGPASLEFETYGNAVQSELLGQGYSAAAPNAPTQYLAVVSYTNTLREGPPKPPPFTIGIGGGGYSGGGYHGGGGVGIGGGVSFPVGKRRSNDLVVTELAVQIRRRSDGTVIWEGRAQTEASEHAAAAQPGVAAAKLAHALFLGFPGESGRSITIK